MPVTPSQASRTVYFNNILVIVFYLHNCSCPLPSFWKPSILILDNDPVARGELNKLLGSLAAQASFHTGRASGLHMTATSFGMVGSASFSFRPITISAGDRRENGSGVLCLVRVAHMNLSVSSEPIGATFSLKRLEISESCGDLPYSPRQLCFCRAVWTF